MADPAAPTFRPRWRRTPWPAASAAALLAAALAAGGIALLDRGDGDERADAARAEVRAFLDAWAAGRHAAAARHTDDPRAAADLLASVGRGLDPKRARFTAGDDVRERAGGAVAVPFTAEFSLRTLGRWRYESTAVVRPRRGGWTVRFSPALLHPTLAEHQTLVLTERRAERAPILAADGTPLAGDGKVWAVSIWPAKLTDPERAYAALGDPLGADLDIDGLRKRVAAAGPDQSVPVVTLRDAVYRKHRERLLPIAGLQFRDGTQPLAYHARSLVGAVEPGTDRGVSALQARYDERLHATPSAEVVTADRDTGQPLRTLAREPAGRGRAVRTTIDPRVQRAAEKALGGLATGQAAGKNAALVAVEPSSGHVLAVADHPDTGENRALTGRYPPGSTFKVITAAALADAGVEPGTRVGCPRYAHAGGRRFENQDEFSLPADTTFQRAFAHSCNTAFVGQHDRLDDDTLRTTAEAFGIGAAWQVGAATFDGSVPAATGAADKAAALIGQGRVEAGPLVMASVAATVQEGTFHQPVLVPAAVDRPHRAPTRLADATVRQLRAMMRAVVTDGSGRALAGLPGRPHAKTGTAEYGTDSPPRTHAWMIGYLGDRDLAFSVLIEDGGSGGRDAGPVAARFLAALE